jgi:uncharacterized protein (TIGR03435 family)
MRRLTQIAMLIGCVAMGVFTYPSIAQDADQQATTPGMMAKDADPDWDVATVKPSDAEGNNSGFHSQGRRMTIQHRTVKDMLIIGYGMHEKQLVGMPGWAESDRWDVEGVVDLEGNPNLTQLQSLVRKILVERFGLRTHTEKREMGVYAITVAKGGPKLEKSKSDPNGSMSENDNDNGGQRTMRMKNATTGDFALVMKYAADRPVVDQTGLNGRYDFQLKWTIDDSKAPTDGTVAPGLFTAVQEQIGLKLEPAKALVDVLVVDRVEWPAPN